MKEKKKRNGLLNKGKLQKHINSSFKLISSVPTKEILQQVVLDIMDYLPEKLTLLS